MELLGVSEDEVGFDVLTDSQALAERRNENVKMKDVGDANEPDTADLMARVREAVQNPDA